MRNFGIGKIASKHWGEAVLFNNTCAKRQQKRRGAGQLTKNLRPRRIENDLVQEIAAKHQHGDARRQVDVAQGAR